MERAVTKFGRTRESRASAIRRILVKRLMDRPRLTAPEALAVIWWTEYYVADKNILKTYNILTTQWGDETIRDYVKVAMRDPGVRSALGLYDDRGRMPAVYEFPSADKLGLDPDFLKYATRRYNLRTVMPPEAYARA